MSLQIYPLVDFAFKKVFGSVENIVALISFLNAVLTLKHPITEITILNPYSEKEYEKDKLSILDIRAKDASGAIFLIEVQLTVLQGLIKRWFYYACKQTASQLIEGEGYSKLRPVYTICLLDGVLWKDSAKLHHRFRLADLESQRILDETVEIHTLELGKYNLKECELGAATPLEQWLFWLIHAHEYEGNELRKLFTADALQLATQALETIKMKSTDLERYQEREKALRDLGWQVQAAHDEGVEEGIKIGTIGKVRVLQELLGVIVAASTELESKTIDELEELASDLQQKLRNRPQSS